LKSQVVELLDEMEQREGQLKKTKDMLVTSEAKVWATKTELSTLKAQTTG
jgi:hypothetical protein